MNTASQLVLDHLRTTKSVEPLVRNYLAAIPSTARRVAWLRRYVAEKTRTARVLEELADAMRKQRLHWKDVEWAELVAILSALSVTEQFLEQILAGNVDVRRAEVIQRYEIVPKGEAREPWPAIHALVSIDTQDGTVYDDKQTYIEATDSGELFALEDPALAADREKIIDQLEKLCRSYERTRR